MMPIGARLHSTFQQMVYARGYDHNFVLNQRPGVALTFAARAYDPRSGRVLDCLTTEPAVQVYTSNGLNGSVIGSSGTTYRQTEGFTLETQHFPDSPNKPNFPSTELKSGQEFRSTTIYRFATDAARGTRRRATWQDSTGQHLAAAAGTDIDFCLLEVEGVPSTGAISPVGIWSGPAGV